MSAAGHRILDSVTRRRESAAAAAREARFWERQRKRELRWETKKQAAIAMTMFAQVLAGTFGQRRDRTPIDKPPRPQRPAPAEREERGEPWRPDQHVETTWEKAMSVPWITPDYGASYGAMLVEQPAEKLGPMNCFAPWPDSVVPSYAPKPEEHD